MKKVLVLVGFLVALSPLSASAQELTRAEVRTIAPQLATALGAISTNLSYTQARINTENALFAQYGNLLGGISTRLGQTPAPTQAELDTIGNTLTEMNRLTAISVSWRANEEAKRSVIVQILSNIVSMISSAV